MILLSKGMPAATDDATRLAIVRDPTLHLCIQSDGQTTRFPLPALSTKWIEWHDLQIFADTRPWSTRTLPDACPEKWLWVSYCGLWDDRWCDGPLARMQGEAICDYVPEGLPATLQLSDCVTTTVPWSRRPQLAQREFLAAATAARHLWPKPHLVREWEDTQTDAALLACLAKAWGTLQVAPPQGITPRMRKLLLHLAAETRTDASDAISMKEVRHGLREFSHLPRDINALSPILPGF